MAVCGALAGAAGAAPRGAPALTGFDAASFRLPPDVVRVWSTRLADGRTQTRYQQKVGAALVLGGQLTVIRDQSGMQHAVIGAHYPGLQAKNRVHVTPDEARRIAEKRVGTAGRWHVRLLVDPRDGRLFHRVESRR